MILVTGATGIVGSHILADLLEKAADRVRVLVRETSSKTHIDALLQMRGLSHDQLDYITGDILDPISLEKATQNCDQVYHAAAMVNFHPRESEALFQCNIQGTANVVDACLRNGVKRLCYISSTAAIGDQPIDGLLTEKSHWTTDKNRSDYSVSKRYAEYEVWRGREEGLEAVIVNPGIVIGPGQWGSSSTSLILSCKDGMRFYPTGANGFVDARDVARFCVESMDSGRTDDRYLLVGENLPFKTVFEHICKAFGSTPPTIPIPKWPVRMVAGMLRSLEWLRLNPMRMTSETLKSAYRTPVYSNERASEAGFRFTPIMDAVAYTVGMYKGVEG